MRRHHMNTRNQGISFSIIIIMLAFVLGIADELSPSAAPLQERLSVSSEKDFPESMSILTAFENEIYIQNENVSDNAALLANDEDFIADLQSVIYTPLSEEKAMLAEMDEEEYNEPTRIDGVAELRNMIANAPSQCNMAAHARDPRSCVALNF